MQISREPVVISGLVTAMLEALIMLALQMGWLSWNSEQIASFNNFIVAFMALAVAAIPLVAAYITRKKVTPVADPRTASGKPAKLVAK